MQNTLNARMSRYPATVSRNHALWLLDVSKAGYTDVRVHDDCIVVYNSANDPVGYYPLEKQEERFGWLTYTGELYV